MTQKTAKLSPAALEERRLSRSTGPRLAKRSASAASKLQETLDQTTDPIERRRLAEILGIASGVEVDHTKGPIVFEQVVDTKPAAKPRKFH